MMGPDLANGQSDWNAKLYESKYSFVWQRAGDVLKLLAPAPGERILDLGCGTGHLTAQIAAAGARVLGIDGSAAMVEEARRNYPDLEFRVADARNFEVEEPFDAVFSNAALHWIREAASVARSIAKGLKPEGRFVAELGGKGNVQKIVTACFAAVGAFGHSATRGVNPWYFPSISEYTSLLEQNGFEVSYARLFDRPTLLEGGEEGLRSWIRMFYGSFYSWLPPDQHEAFLQHVEKQLRPDLFKDGAWWADYRRLQVSARREVAA